MNQTDFFFGSDGGDVAAMYRIPLNTLIIVVVNGIDAGNIASSSGASGRSSSSNPIGGSVLRSARSF